MLDMEGFKNGCSIAVGAVETPAGKCGAKWSQIWLWHFPENIGILGLGGGVMVIIMDLLFFFLWGDQEDQHKVQDSLKESNNIASTWRCLEDVAIIG